MTKEMGLYCKAYYLRELRAFGSWKEEQAFVRPDGESDDSPARPLQDDDIVFVHDDYSVTSGVFADMIVINDPTVAGWPAFCRDVLDFAVPADVIEAGALAARDLADIER